LGFRVPPSSTTGERSPSVGRTCSSPGAGLALSLVLVWSESDSERSWKVLVVLVAFGGATAQASRTTARRRADDPRSVQLLYLGALAGGVLGRARRGVLLASLISLAAWQEIEDDSPARSTTGAR